MKKRGIRSLPLPPHPTTLSGEKGKGQFSKRNFLQEKKEETLCYCTEYGSVKISCHLKIVMKLLMVMKAWVSQEKVINLEKDAKKETLL